MKHLKTFEQYSFDDKIEEGVIRKFLTGHETKEDQNKSKSEFEKSLDEAMEELKKNPDEYKFGHEPEKLRDFLLKKAKENKYLGGLRVQKGGGSDKRYFVVYDKGATGFEKLATAATQARST